MSDPRSDLDGIRARMSVRRTELRVVEPVSEEPVTEEREVELPPDGPAATALAAGEEALAEARAWEKARRKAFVTTGAATQLSLVEFLR